MLLACLTLGGIAVALDGDQHGDMAHMAGHMYMTVLRIPQPGDRQKADAVVAAAKAAMGPYQDYHKALADGYEIFLPDLPQAQYHFTKYEYGLEARSHFDPNKPTSLLYKKTADGGFKLIGAMYTDRVNAHRGRVQQPDSAQRCALASTHQFLQGADGTEGGLLWSRRKVGLLSWITTQEACEAAGGVLHAHIFGWMVHVYPYETDAKNIWSTDDDDQGHDNMDHSVMPGMKMN